MSHTTQKITLSIKEQALLIQKITQPSTRALMTSNITLIGKNL